MATKALGQKFYDRPTVDLARSLLGKYLVLGGLRGKIVETEAYLYYNDPGCHAHRGMTPRNAPMFGPAGRTYVYLIYGMYHCLNVVSGRVGDGEAVLIRALEPVDGIDVMTARRGTNKIVNLCNGPGKLTRAFGITKAHNNKSLFDGGVDSCELRILDNNEYVDIVTTTRIGLSAGKDLPLRFYIKGSPYVSR